MTTPLVFRALVVLVAWAKVDAQQDDVALAAAMAASDECRNPDGPETCALSALQVRKTKASWCAEANQACGWWKGCCAGSTCQQLLGGAGSQCVKENLCGSESASCSGDGDCCGGMQCQHLLGGSGSQCTKKHDPQPVCQASGASCGGPGQLTLKCCGDAACTAGPGGAMTCVQEACQASGAYCGGIGQRTLTCCG
eukprot:CAMPEP_0198498034 /NCGR_PEP_ID=MMETSP1462-20131121/6761_1 /TAXON_ID=1333877 /ORGANISM="Brandtodinium nutriculum, Strain RCC3387" /LENGTH=195 /DNA_ID=CAMNT_0044226931 /DNA_START=81 /DNA_END=665 /DNA_ORIENTATION=+